MYIKYFKRIFDIVFVVMALPFWIFLFVIVGPIIFFQDHGPIFYNASRIGKNGKIFKMYKFRSMRVNAEDLRNDDGSTFNAENDTRLTRIGKFIRMTSIDESPQIFNIIKGDMSLIGPRPDLPEHKELYVGNEIRKLEVKPGITGYSQAYFRNNIPWKEKIMNDIYYIDNISLWFDIRIILKTFVTVLKRSDIYVIPKTRSENKE